MESSVSSLLLCWPIVSAVLVLVLTPRFHGSIAASCLFVDEMLASYELRWEKEKNAAIVVLGKRIVIKNGSLFEFHL